MFCDFFFLFVWFLFGVCFVCGGLVCFFQLYPALVLSQSSSASLVALLTDCVIIREQQCLLSVSGELELFFVRKDSQSAILSLLFTLCEVHKKCLHVRYGEAVSKARAGSPR